MFCHLLSGNEIDNELYESAMCEQILCKYCNIWQFILIPILMCSPSSRCNPRVNASAIVDICSHLTHFIASWGHLTSPLGQLMIESASFREKIQIYDIISDLNHFGSNQIGTSHIWHFLIPYLSMPFLFLSD